MNGRHCVTGGDHTLSPLDDLPSIGGRVMECVAPGCHVQVVEDTDGVRHVIVYDDELVWVDRLARSEAMATMAGEAEAW